MASTISSKVTLLKLFHFFFKSNFIFFPDALKHCY